MSKRVLVVDDAAFMRMMIRDILERTALRWQAKSFQRPEAVKAYQEVKPDIVTMDITMPEMSGIEAVKAIKR